MTPPSFPRNDDHTPREAAALFAGWLARPADGEALDLETLCRQHPELAAELRDLHQQWQCVQEVLERLGVTTSVAERLQTQLGDGVAPQISLSGEAPSGAGRAAAASESLARQLALLDKGTLRYQVEGEVARGGMGVILKVWDKELRRPLAMKVILGQATAPSAGDAPAVDPEQAARFLEEAQVTGQLDHPGVVPVHELGLDRDGRLYFTMRLVKGRELREVFRMAREGAEGWNLTRALGVLLKACEAVAYAHSKGVVHRDLKPSNVMVGSFGEVYVMDWGIAKVLGVEDRHDVRIDAPVTSLIDTDRKQDIAASPDSPLITMDGRVIGTPAYMSLEQAEGRIGDVGPRSDVYSFGSMLYELLTGQVPYARPGAMMSPHTVLSALLAGPPTPIHQINPDAPAELVAICDKSMARRATDRYSNTDQLAEDLRAFLENRVVGAYRTGALVELRKWVVRNRGLATASAAAIIMALAGTASTAWVEHRRKKDVIAYWQQAETAKELAWTEGNRARQQAARAGALNQFLVDTFTSIEPQVAQGRDVLVRELLDTASLRFAAEFQGEPELEASLRMTLAETYRALWLNHLARPHVEAALILYQGVAEPDAAQIAKAYLLLASCNLAQGKYAAAGEAGRRAEAISAGMESPDKRLLADSVLVQARAAMREFDRTTAFDLADRADALVLGAYGSNHKTLALLHRSRGRMLLEDGQLDAAEDALRAAEQQLIGANGGGSLPRSDILDQLARISTERGDHLAARGLMQRTLEIQRTLLDPDHPVTLLSVAKLARSFQEAGEQVPDRFLASLHEASHKLTATTAEAGVALTALGIFFQSQGDFASAEPLFQRAVSIYGQLKERERRDLDAAIALFNLGCIQGLRRDCARAIENLTKSLALRQGLLGEAHIRNMAPLRELAYVLLMTGRHEEAEAYAQRAVAIGEQAGRSDDPGLAEVRSVLAEIWTATGRAAEAEPVLVRCRKILETARGEFDLQTLYCCGRLAACWARLGRSEDAEDLYLMLAETYELEPQAGKVGAARMLNELGEMRLRNGEIEGAREAFLEGLRMLRESVERDWIGTVNVLNNAGVTHYRRSEWSLSLPLLREAVETARDHLHPTADGRLHSLHNLASAMEKLKRDDEAISLWQELRDTVREHRGDDDPLVRKAIQALARLNDGN